MYSCIPFIGRPIIGRFWEKLQNVVNLKFSSYWPVFRGFRGSLADDGYLTLTSSGSWISTISRSWIWAMFSSIWSSKQCSISFSSSSFSNKHHAKSSSFWSGKGSELVFLQLDSTRIHISFFKGHHLVSSRHFALMRHSN